MDHANPTEVNELSPLESQVDGQRVILRRFSLSANGVTVELCSVGASITKFLVGKSKDDIVLGYSSPVDMLAANNPLYFGVVVGRVANRIAKGEFQTTHGGPVYKTKPNNGPNLLHGGCGGFSNQIWNGKIVTIPGVQKAVRFTLLSHDGDQGFPGTLTVSATYSLREEPSSDSKAVKLSLQMEARLEDGKATPVNLAQHSYFNLARHDDPVGILDHRLEMKNCEKYTPLDETSIPTREVRAVTDDPCMDCRQSRLLRTALSDFAVQKKGLSNEQAMRNTQKSRIAPDIATVGGEPYGFDHNYIVECTSQTATTRVAVLDHARSQRRLTVSSNTPGVQLYTANYLDGTTPSITETKDGARYGQWQGLCLETQHFPSSILVDEESHPEFSKGACTILTQENPHYQHCVEYLLEYDIQEDDNTMQTEPRTIDSFRGSDTDGNQYRSVREMWTAQGVVPGVSPRETWYDRASNYYEDNCAPTVDGMLGGFAAITDIDLAGSRRFLTAVKALCPSGFDWSSAAACECGAGIGRVTKGLLLPLGVTRSDLVESSSRLLYAAPEYLGDALAGKCRFYCMGLQDWQPAPNTYSIVWIQWVLVYLTDDDIVAFLKRCGEALVPGGVVVLKENTCEDEDFVVDVEDASVTRSVEYWRHLCKESGLRLLYEQRQDDFPDEIYPVPMLALVRD